MSPGPGLDERYLVDDSQTHELVPGQSRERLADAVHDALFFRREVVLVLPRGDEGFGGHVPVAQAVGGGRRVGDPLGHAHADIVRWLAEQVPQEGPPGARDGGGDVGRGVAQADGEDADVGGGRQ